MSYRSSLRLIVAVAIIVALGVASISLLPEAARRVAVRRLQDMLTAPVSIADVDLNLFTGRATIESLVIGEGPRPILTIPAIVVDFSRAALLTGELHLQRIAIEQPRVAVERLGPTTYNVTRAFRLPGESKGPTTDGPVFTIQRLEITAGEVRFIDRTQDPDYEIAVSSIELTAGPIASLPAQAAPQTDFTAALAVANGTIELAGMTRPAGGRFRTELTARISNVELQTFDVYLPYGRRLKLAKSLLDGQARYMIVYGDQKISEHSLEANLTIGPVGLLDTQTGRTIALTSGVAARDLYLDLLEGAARIAAITIDQPYLFVARDASGFNLDRLFPAGEGAHVAASNDAWFPVSVKLAEVNGGTIEFVDQAVSPPAHALISGLRISADDLQIGPSFTAAGIKAEAYLGKGALKVSGAISGEPLSGQLSVTAERLPFEPFRGYLNRLFTAAHSSGDRLDGRLKITLSPRQEGEIITTVTGALQGYDMALRFAEDDRPFLTTDRLTVDLQAIRLDENPAVAINSINLTGAALRIVRSQGGAFNLTRLWQSDEEAEPGRSRERQNGAETSLAIRSINVERGLIDVLDRSVSPNYHTTISQLQGTLTDLRRAAKRAHINVQGVLGESADLRLTGWLTPFTDKPMIHLEGTIRSYAVPPLNPYATRFLSHRIRQGQITTEVSYTLKGDEIQATADVVLRDLQVGEKTGDEFEERIGIPLQLAVALLKDIQGVIRLHLAMSGGAGPTVDISSLIWNALRNAIVRAITAPFRLVGQILTFGGRIGELRVEPIPFEPGTREMTAAGVKQLEQLSMLLKEKPEIRLTLVGNAGENEIHAIKTRIFWERIQRAEGENYQEALVYLYRQMGGVTQPSVPLPPAIEESLERFVRARIEVTAADLRQLARDRAQIVRAELERRGVDASRLAARAAEDVPAAEAAAVEIRIA
ncbi:MAG TPA: DUF748 domain-containing protein [Candidatus Eisenbacteria bacterium]|nr:DUF748 domain-containing protein [Candidatus Eisenbacteria bacterium]